MLHFMLNFVFFFICQCSLNFYELFQRIAINFLCFYSLSETYLTVKGAALMLSSSNCLRTAGNDECEKSQGSRK